MDKHKSQDSSRPRLGGSHHLPIFPHLSYGACTQMSFPRTPKLGILKFPKLRFLQLWKPIIFCSNVWLKWGLKGSCNPPQELFNNMWHATCTKINQGDFWLLVVGSQIGSLTPDPSFGHSLCFKYSNGSCEPILDIYVLRTFQRFKVFFNPINFDPWNRPLKIRESQSGSPFGSVWVHSFTLSYTLGSMKCDS